MQHLAFQLRDCVCNQNGQPQVITYSLRSVAGRVESPWFNIHLHSSFVISSYFDFCKGEHQDVWVLLPSLELYLKTIHENHFYWMENWNSGEKMSVLLENFKFFIGSPSNPQYEEIFIIKDYFIWLFSCSEAENNSPHLLFFQCKEYSEYHGENHAMIWVWRDL